MGGGGGRGKERMGKVKNRNRQKRVTTEKISEHAKEQGWRISSC